MTTIDSSALYIHLSRGAMLDKINTFLETKLEGVNLNFNLYYMGGVFSCSHKFYDSMNFFYLPTGHTAMTGRVRGEGIRVEIIGCERSEGASRDVIEKIRLLVACDVPEEAIMFPVDTSARM